MRSQTERDLTAESTPIGMPIASHMTTAPSERTIVAGMRSRICGRTFGLFWYE